MNSSKCTSLYAAALLASVAGNALAAGATPLVALPAAAASGTDRVEAGAKGTKDSKYLFLHVTRAKRASEKYYFNSDADLNACLVRLGQKQPKKSLEIKWHNYTFVTGDLTGQTVRQADSCNWVAETPGPAVGCGALGQGINVVERGAICNGSSDDTVAIQGILDTAASGALVCIPNLPDKHRCGLSNSLAVRKPVRLSGFGKAANSQLRRITDHPLTGSTATHEAGAILHVTSSDVEISGLKLIGFGYGDANARNTHGILATGASFAAPISNLTIRENVLTSFRGRGVSLSNAQDFLVQGNDVSKAGYAGIWFYAVQRGVAKKNSVVDVGSPTQCAYTDLRNCQYGNAYPIVVTGCEQNNCSTDVIISDNYVRENELWVGIMNHGGERILIDSNKVYDTSFLYANTVSEAYTGFDRKASHDTTFINNFGDIHPTFMGGRFDELGGWMIRPSRTDLAPEIAPLHAQGQWLASFPDPVTRGAQVIGNTYRNTGRNGQSNCISGDASDHAVITHNICSWDTPQPPISSPPIAGYGLALAAGHSQTDLVFAHNVVAACRAMISSLSPSVTNMLVQGNELSNELTYAAPYGLTLAGGSWDVRSDNNFKKATPVSGTYNRVNIADRVVPAPKKLRAKPIAGSGSVLLTWDYPKTSAESHDSFYIEHRTTGAFERQAYRPGNDRKWVFKSTNSQLTPFNPLSYLVEKLARRTTHEFRIRTNDRQNVSPWSATVSVKVD